jgi:hypothetical protein
MNPSIAAGLIALVFLALLFLVLRKVTNLASREADLNPILYGISSVQRGQEQIDRFTR